MSRIHFDRVSFAYADAAPILSSVSFSIASPGVVGLVGANGSGKSTLLALVRGDLAPAEGRVIVEPRDAIIVSCAQSADDVTPEIQALASASDRDAVRLRATLDLQQSALVRFETLSPGERRRWQIGAALLAMPDVLLLDEPTNHLDAAARAFTERTLATFAARGGLAILVSHDRALLDHATQETLGIQDNNVLLFTGNYGAAEGAWDAEARAREAHREEKRRELRTAERALDRAKRNHAAAERQRSSGARMKGKHDHDARGALAKGQASMAEARLGSSVASLGAAKDRAERALSEARVGKAFGRDVTLRAARAPARRIVSLVTRALLAGDRVLARDVHMTIDRGDRVHVAGPNGAGKSTLLRAIFDASGAQRDRVVLVPQEIDAMTVARDLEHVKRAPPLERGHVLSLFAALGGSPDRLLASRAPSPGEAKKLSLARALGGEVSLCLLDEPENHLDLPAIRRLEAALESFSREGALVLVTHDDALARAVTTTRIEIHDQAIFTRDPRET